MKVLITGANGFIAKNLIVYLSNRKDIDVVAFTRDHTVNTLSAFIEEVAFIVHLAGVNRPDDVNEFELVNSDLTEMICSAVEKSGKNIPIIFGSSIQAEADNPYGISKLSAEKALINYSNKSGNTICIFRLPNVFGKWCKPNYNSVIATFCHNIIYDLPIKISDPLIVLRLVYIDDVVNKFISIIDGEINDNYSYEVVPEYKITLGQLADKIKAFKDSRNTLVVEEVGVGFDRALHSTYLSYLPPNKFSYSLVKHGDERGVFVEMLKTKTSGQISYFTAHPGVTRGGHYHHSKTEKFLVLKGNAVFKFRHIITNEFHQIETSGNEPMIIETIPGWVHDITNIGDEEMIVMLWANEIFDINHPDTYAGSL